MNLWLTQTICAGHAVVSSKVWLYWFEAEDHWAMVYWSPSSGYWRVQFWQPGDSETDMLRGDGPCNPPEKWGGDWEQIPNPWPLPAHPCANCDMPIAHIDYLCLDCRRGL